MLRVGLVGCGFIGNVHSWALWALRKTGVVDLSVVAVCDADAERAAGLAAPHDAEVCDLDSLLERVDVVYVCTPTAQHLAVVEAAAARSLAIFCEKPLATDLTHAQRVADVLRTVPHQVGLVLRAAPVFETLRTRITSGAYGRPMAVSLRDDQFFPIQGHYGSTWRAQQETAGGGTLIEHSIHDIDVLRWLLGEPLDVSCRTSSFFDYSGIEDMASATMRFDGGLVANLLSVWHQVLTRPSTRRLEVFCEEAFLWTEDDNTGPLHVETSKGAEELVCPLPEWTHQIPVPEQVRDSLGLYAEASRRFLADVRTTSPDADDALAAHRIVDGCYTSAAKSGEAISLC